MRTRASKADPCSRFYSPNDFDVVAACLHAVSERWEFRYVAKLDRASRELQRKLSTGELATAGIGRLRMCFAKSIGDERARIDGPLNLSAMLWIANDVSLPNRRRAAFSIEQAGDRDRVDVPLDLSPSTVRCVHAEISASSFRSGRAEARAEHDQRQIATVRRPQRGHVLAIARPRDQTPTQDDLVLSVAVLRDPRAARTQRPSGRRPEARSCHDDELQGRPHPQSGNPEENDQSLSSSRQDH